MKKRKSTDFIVIHCSATSPSMDIGKQEIERWHRSRGWLTIGYHYVIRRDGTIETGRPGDVIGAHVSGHNSNSIGICIVGGVSEKDKRTPENNFTQEQFNSLIKLVKKLKVKYDVAKVCGHRDFNKNKACPCFEVSEINF